MKRDKFIQQRADFCQLAFKDSKKAADQLRSLAKGLENCKRTSDVIYALQNIFCVSERTIFNDIVR